MKARKIRAGDEFITNQGDTVYIVEYRKQLEIIAEFREPERYQF